MVKLEGKDRTNAKKKVVRLRLKGLKSWRTIGAELDITPRMANRLFQEAVGKHQQHDHLPGKGGRFPASYTTTAEAPYLAGDGTNNTWEKVESPEEA